MWPPILVLLPSRLPQLGYCYWQLSLQHLLYLWCLSILPTHTLTFSCIYSSVQHFYHLFFLFDLISVLSFPFHHTYIEFFCIYFVFLIVLIIFFPLVSFFGSYIPYFLFSFLFVSIGFLSLSIHQFYSCLLYLWLTILLNLALTTINSDFSLDFRRNYYRFRHPYHANIMFLGSHRPLQFRLHLQRIYLVLQHIPFGIHPFSAHVHLTHIMLTHYALEVCPQISSCWHPFSSCQFITTIFHH